MDPKNCPTKATTQGMDPKNCHTKTTTQGMDPKTCPTKPRTQGKTQTSNGTPSSNMYSNYNPISRQTTIVQGSSYPHNSQNTYASDSFPDTTHFQVGPTPGAFTPISNPIPTPHTTMPQNSTNGYSSQTMYANNPIPTHPPMLQNSNPFNNPIPTPSTPIPQNTTHFLIGPTMGSFAPIPNQGGKTPTNASYDIPQPNVGSLNSLPFTYNQHVVIYQQSGQTISNHTSNADHMNPNRPVPTQPQKSKTKVNEGQPSEGNTLKKRDCSSALGYEAVDLNNSPNFVVSQQRGQVLSDLAQQVNNMKMLVCNLWGQFNTMEAYLRDKSGLNEDHLRDEFNSMKERDCVLKKKLKHLEDRVAQLFDEDEQHLDVMPMEQQVQSSLEGPSSRPSKRAARFGGD